MKKVLLSVCMLIAIVSLVACGSNNDSKAEAKAENDAKFDSTNIEDDTKFAVNVADAGMFEVAVSQLALTNASAASVKNFAQMLIDDHSSANTELKSAAAKKNISLPEAISIDKQKKYDDLSTKHGEIFDRAYVDCMIDAHKDAIDAFQKESEKGNDPDLRSWAAGKLATLQHHYEVIKGIKDAKK
jgi:putative membrane protein